MDQNHLPRWMRSKLSLKSSGHLRRNAPRSHLPSWLKGRRPQYQRLKERRMVLNHDSAARAKESALRSQIVGWEERRMFKRLGLRHPITPNSPRLNARLAK